MLGWKRILLVFLAPLRCQMICTADIDFPHTNTREFRPFDGGRAAAAHRETPTPAALFLIRLWRPPLIRTQQRFRSFQSNTRKKQEANLVIQSSRSRLCLYFYAFNASYAMLTDWTASLSLYVVYINWISFLSSCVFILSHVATRTHLHFYSLTHQHSYTGRNLLCNFFSSYFHSVLV